MECGLGCRCLRKRSAHIEPTDRPSRIDPFKPEDGVPPVKANFRANLQAAKT
jgi:hypothetical protein